MNTFDHSNEKASTCSASGSFFQEKYLSICLFILEAKISISGIPHLSTNVLKIWLLSFHSVLSEKCRDP